MPRFLSLLLAVPLAALASAAPPVAESSKMPLDAAPEAPSGHKLCSGDDIASKRPQILSGYGKGGFAIHTSIPAAQEFFSNGMELAFAFAHSAAQRAMAEAVRLDPACAACLWGEAWASGPTINYPTEASDIPALAGKVARARRLATNAPEKERALIDALAARYPAGKHPKGTNDRAFAEAMDTLARRWPDDNAIATITADAWMIAGFSADSRATLPRAIELLEAALKRDPDYTPAIHFYIHATEVAGTPERAERYADRLPALAPSASHLVHMPSHTYYHIGRYQDAVDANMAAVALGRANAKRLGMPEPDGVWNLPYHAHNVQYGVGAALISGDSNAALALSDPIVAMAARGRTGRGDAYDELVAATAYFAQARFADPARVLAMPAPAPAFRYARAYWHYARGEAAAKLGDSKRVRAEAAAMPPIQGRESKDDGSATAMRMVRIARLVLEGRGAMLDNRPAAALSAYRRAAKLQETGSFLDYADPPAFWYPVRRDVASTLLALRRGPEALAEAEATLKLWPKEPETEKIRGRALAGLLPVRGMLERGR